MANSFGSPLKSLAMVSTVWSPSRTSDDLRGVVEELGVRLGDVEPAEREGGSGRGEDEHGGEGSDGERAFMARLPPGATPRSAARMPLVARAGQEPVDQGDDEGARGERPEQAVGAEEHELHDAGADRDEDGEQDAARARVRRRPRVGDHEEREEQEGAVLEPMERDRRAARRARAIGRPAAPRSTRGRPRHVAARGAVDDQRPRRGEQEGEDGRAAPLPGRDPDARPWRASSRRWRSWWG